MNNHVVEITEINITTDEVELTAAEIEEALMAENLFEAFEVPQIRFTFDRHNKSEMLYLFMLVTTKSNRKLSLSERINKLLGKTISISPNFIEK